MTTNKIKEDSTRLLNRIEVIFESEKGVPGNEVKPLLELQKSLGKYLEGVK
jgi:hypothetical protein